MTQFNLTPLGKIVWEDRYALKDQDGNIKEGTILDTFRRAAKAIASKEANYSKIWEDKFYSIMEKGQFSPAGRVLAHSGTNHSQLLNCFVIPFKDDSLEEIMNTAKNVAVVQKYSGGTGLNYSVLRPSGSYIKGVNGRSCGVIGFLNMMSTMSEVIEQGGCLTEDSLINTAEGLLYLREIIKERKRGWHDHLLEVKTKDGNFKSSKYFVNGYSDIIRIKTDCGIVLRGTPSHKLYVLSDEGPVWKEFNSIRKGDWVISNTGQHEGTKQSLVNIQKKHHNCIIPEKLPSIIDKEFAFFLGYYVGNGFSTVKEGDHRLGVTIPDKSYLVNKITNIYGNLFGKNIGVTVLKKRKDKSRTYYISNRIIKEFFSINGLQKHRSPSAAIPLKIRQSPSNIVAAYIAGLFESDGALCHGYPMVSTTSQILATELQALLFGLGIPCAISGVKRGLRAFSKRPMYRVCVVSPKGLEVWNKTIHVDPLSRFQTCCSHKTLQSNQRWYILPHGKFWLKKALDSLPKYKRNSEQGSLRKQLTRYIRGDRNLTLSAYSELMKYFDDGKLPAVGNNFYSKVKDITHEKDFTCDLEVNESHSYVANTLISHNSRRGANLGLLEVSHPDVWELISYKREHNWDQLKEFIEVKDGDKWESFKFDNFYKLQMYNISIGITDEFLEAVKNDALWPLLWKGMEWELYTVVFKKSKGGGLFKEKTFSVVAYSDATALWKVKRLVPYPGASDKFEIREVRKIKASEIWDRICYNAWADGCPGIINMSTARRMHNIEYVHPLTSGNPCAEQLLPAMSSCNLSSLVLSSFVKNGSFDFEEFKRVIHIAVRFGDNVIDNCFFPLKDIELMAQKERRVGLGVMAVHDALIAMGLGYDTEEGRRFIETILIVLRDEAYKTSIELAKEKGSFPVFDADKLLECSGFIQTLSPEIRADIKKHGLRNATLISVAPTGTIGTMYNVSTGCEPWFSLSYQRNTRMGSYEDGCPFYIKWKQENPGKEKPSYFKTAQEISPEDHVRMMILFSKYTDSSVSKTVNLPSKATTDDVNKIFFMAMENGVKGITIFRDQSKEGVLVKKPDNQETPEEIKKNTDTLQVKKSEDPESRVLPKKRGNRLEGATYRVHMQGHNLYIIVNKNTEGEIVEIFTTVGESKKTSAHHTSGVEDSWAEGLGKIISLALRAGVTPHSIIRNLKNIPSDKPLFSTIGDCPSELISSPPHAIARAIEEEIRIPVKGIVEKSNVKETKRCENCGSLNTRPKGSSCYECLDCFNEGC